MEYTEEAVAKLCEHVYDKSAEKNLLELLGDLLKVQSRTMATLGQVFGRGVDDGIQPVEEPGQLRWLRHRIQAAIEHADEIGKDIECISQTIGIP